MNPPNKWLLEAAFSYTSPDTYYRRFHTAKRSFTARELTYLTEADGADHVALIATDPAEDGRLAAVARYFRDGEEAELAIAVHDPYQGRGVGRELLELLCLHACGHGIRRLTAAIQTDNHRMVRLLRAVCGAGNVRHIGHCAHTDWVADLT